MSLGFAESVFESLLTDSELDELEKTYAPQLSIDNAFLTRRRELGLVDLKRGELYPEIIGFGVQIKRILSMTYGLEAFQVQPNFGCNGCIDAFLNAVQFSRTSRRGKVVVATPTYFRYYQKLDSLGLELEGVPVLNDFQVDVDALLEKVNEVNPVCVLLVTPNNPTGVPIPDEAIVRLIENIPEEVPVAIDRTCVNIDTEISSKELISKFREKRLVIFHSFSKYKSLSHMRLGFSLISNPEFAIEMSRFEPFGLNLEALVRGIRILAEDGELKPSQTILTRIRANRYEMERFILSNPEFQCSDFRSNYGILTVPMYLDPRLLSKNLRESGFLVMPGYELPGTDANTFRIHCGGEPSEFSKFIDAIKEYCV